MNLNYIANYYGSLICAFMCMYMSAWFFFALFLCISFFFNECSMSSHYLPEWKTDSEK